MIGPERHPNADFLRSLRNCVGGHTLIETYRVGSSDFPVVRIQLAESPMKIWRTSSLEGNTTSVCWTAKALSCHLHVDH